MYQLRYYQQAAVDRALDFFNGSDHRGAIEVLPTGSGKSLVIAGIAQKLEDPLIVFQPSKEILEQNISKLRAYGFEDCSIYSASLNRKEISKVTFATIGSVRTKPELFKEFQNIIVDECHGVSSKGGMYKQFFDVVGGKILGLTATPYRLVTDGFGGSILKFLTRTRPRIFEKVIYHVQNGELFEAGYLAKIRYRSLDGFDTNQLKLNTTGADFTDESVRIYYNKIGFAGRLKDSVERLLLLRKNILVFTRFVEEAHSLVASVPGGAVVSAMTPKAERERIISGFKKGEIRYVANVGILTVGFDYPELETVVMARPTRSLALYYQMIGRSIRPHPSKDHSLILDLCDNCRRFGKVEDLRLVEPRPSLWHLESNGRQLTNIYFDWNTSF